MYTLTLLRDQIEGIESPAVLDADAVAADKAIKRAASAGLFAGFYPPGSPNAGPLPDVADSVGYVVGPPLGSALCAALGKTGGLALFALAIAMLLPAVLAVAEG